MVRPQLAGTAGSRKARPRKRRSGQRCKPNRLALSSRTTAHAISGVACVPSKSMTMTAPGVYCRRSPAPVALCPSRFEQDNLLLKWLGDIMGFAQGQLSVAREIPFMENLQDQQAGGENRPDCRQGCQRKAGMVRAGDTGGIFFGQRNERRV